MTTTHRLVVTKTIIAANLIFFVYLAQKGGGLAGTHDAGRISPELKYTLWAPAISPCGQWWRVITSGFVHFGLAHIAFNMFILYLVANVLESEAGSLRFGLIYAVSLVTGSLGALILSPNVNTGGASGAVFGVAAAAALLLMRRGSTFWNTGFGPLLLINMAYTLIAPNISIGGHLGGAVGGIAVGAVLLREEPTRNEQVATISTALGLLVLAFAACLWVAAAKSPAGFNCVLVR
jgi:membrane associated rhomboid family serine protease